jgi:hypothetical protein
MTEPAHPPLTLRDLRRLERLRAKQGALAQRTYRKAFAEKAEAVLDALLEAVDSNADLSKSVEDARNDRDGALAATERLRSALWYFSTTAPYDPLKPGLPPPILTEGKRRAEAALQASPPHVKNYPAGEAMNEIGYLREALLRIGMADSGATETPTKVKDIAWRALGYKDYGQSYRNARAVHRNREHVRRFVRDIANGHAGLVPLELQHRARDVLTRNTELEPDPTGKLVEVEAAKAYYWKVRYLVATVSAQEHINALEEAKKGLKDLGIDEGALTEGTPAAPVSKGRK